jgi:hypothetical protein
MSSSVKIDFNKIFKKTSIRLAISSELSSRVLIYYFMEGEQTLLTYPTRWDNRSGLNIDVVFRVKELSPVLLEEG